MVNVHALKNTLQLRENVVQNYIAIGISSCDGRIITQTGDVI